jgi:tight adherence protein C
MTFIILGLCLFIGFVFLFLLLTPRTTAAGALLQEAVRPTRVQADVPAWRAAIDVEFFAKPFTVVRRIFRPEPDPQLVRRLSLAGYRNPASADIYMGCRLAIPAILGVLIAVFITDNVIMYFIIGVGLGFFAPDFWLNWAIKKRRDKIRLSLPDGLDFLAICLEAGLGLDQAVLRLSQELRVSHPQLAEELQQINFEQRAGVPRIAAWKSFAERTNLESVRSFVAMLIQTDRFGTPISKSLGAFSDALRTARRQKAEELAAKTTIKLLFPLVFFIAPSMGIVLLGPAAISIVKSFKRIF